MGLNFLHDDTMDKLSERINKTKQEMSAGVFKSRGEIEYIFDVSIDDALYFYTDDNRLRTSRDPQSMLNYAKRCRNVLIRSSKWTDAYQNIYEDMKKSGIRCNIISDIDEFESDELTMNR